MRVACDTLQCEVLYRTQCVTNACSMVHLCSGAKLCQWFVRTKNTAVHEFNDTPSWLMIYFIFSIFYENNFSQRLFLFGFLFFVFHLIFCSHQTFC